jgi:hypothetical protein
MGLIDVSVSLIAHTVKPMDEASFDKWSFVVSGFDQEHWYIQLTGGLYHGVVYKYEHIKLNVDNESIDFDYEIIDYLGDDPHGETTFNQAAGKILQSILEDALEHQDFVLGSKK